MMADQRSTTVVAGILCTRLPYCRVQKAVLLLASLFVTSSSLCIQSLQAPKKLKQKFTHLFCSLIHSLYYAWKCVRIVPFGQTHRTILFNHKIA